MKKPLLPPAVGAVLLLLAVITVAIPQQAVAEEVEVNATAKTPKRSNGKGGKVTSSKRLDIELGNFHREDLKDLTIKWKLLGRDIKTHNLLLLKKGEEKVSVLRAGEEKVITTAEVKLEEDTKVAKSRGRSRGRRRRGGSSTRVAQREGKEYGGYWVEVIDSSGKVVGSDYSFGMKKRGAKL